VYWCVLAITFSRAAVGMAGITSDEVLRVTYCGRTNEQLPKG